MFRSSAPPPPSSQTHAAYSVVRMSKQKKLLPDDFLEKTFSEYLPCHPTYMIPLIRAHNYILRDLGPLNYATRHYIGILAATRHRCTYLINFAKKEYLFHGGDPEWLKGLQFAHPKIRALSTINKILAHQPWLFTKSHIEALTKGPTPWSLSELTHAIIILAHYHSLCSLAFGCKFGFAEPENFDDEDCDCVDVEIEELCFDEDHGTQRIKKIVRRSPASRLIIERCRQLELENAQLAEIMKTKIKVKDKERETKKEQKEQRKKEKQERKKQNKEKQREQKEHQQQQAKSQPVKVAKSEGQQGVKGQGASGADSPTSGSVASTSSSVSSGNLSSSPSTSTKPSKQPKQADKSPNASNKSSESNTQSTRASTSTTTSATSNADNNKPMSMTTSTSLTSDNANDNNDKPVNPSLALVPFVENTWSEDEWARHNYGALVDDGEFAYVDFASRGKPSDVSTFRVQDYQWDDQGYSLSNLLYPDIGPFLDEKFKVGYNLTYYTLGPKTNIDTSPFRRAIWNYVQCVYGMRHDDYNYREVNILLERSIKTFIKCLTCYPETVVKQDFSQVMKGFRASEKIHVIIMLTEARLQAELLYALRSLTEYMKH